MCTLGTSRHQGWSSIVGLDIEKKSLAICSALERFHLALEAFQVKAMTGTLSRFSAKQWLFHFQIISALKIKGTLILKAGIKYWRRKRQF